eukprot:gene31261-biopygen47390
MAPQAAGIPTQAPTTAAPSLAPSTSPTSFPSITAEPLTVSGGSWGTEVSWQLQCPPVDGDIIEGGAPYDGTLSLTPGMQCGLTMMDSYGDGWNGFNWQAYGLSFTLSSGSLGTEEFTIPLPPQPPSGAPTARPVGQGDPTASPTTLDPTSSPATPTPSAHPTTPPTQFPTMTPAWDLTAGPWDDELIE